MYIEDILDKLLGIMPRPGLLYHDLPFISVSDKGILNSLYLQCAGGSAFTEKQAVLVERILKKYTDQISKTIGNDIIDSVQHPKYKLGKRVLPNAKKVQVVQVGNIKKIYVSFPYDQNLISRIKGYNQNRGSYKQKWVQWNVDNKVWVFDVREPNILWLFQNLADHAFIFDEEITSWFDQIVEVEKNIDKHVPMVIFKNNKFEFINSHANIPQPTSTDLLEVLFYAKKCGIYTWDDSINLALDDAEFNQVTRKFLKNQENTVEQKNITFVDSGDVIKYSNSILVVIPTGEEYETLKFCHQRLLSMGYTNDEFSVLFRTEVTRGKETNEYIKQHSLNNPISEKIKFYFVSLKFPKPLIRNKIKFDTVINFGAINAHHTLRNFIKYHHNVLYYTTKLDNNGNL